MSSIVYIIQFHEEKDLVKNVLQEQDLIMSLFSLDFWRSVFTLGHYTITAKNLLASLSGLAEALKEDDSTRSGVLT